MDIQAFIIGKLLADRKAKKLAEQGAETPPNYSNRHAIAFGSSSNPILPILSMEDEASNLSSQAETPIVKGVSKAEFEALVEQVEELENQLAMLANSVPKLIRKNTSQTK